MLLLRVDLKPPHLVIALRNANTPQGITEAKDCLNKEFETKDLGKTKFCLGLQIEHFKDGVLLHHATYIEKILK